jgi:hypothetical protein
MRATPLSSEGVSKAQTLKSLFRSLKGDTANSSSAMRLTSLCHFSISAAV